MRGALDIEELIVKKFEEEDQINCWDGSYLSDNQMKKYTDLEWWKKEIEEGKETKDNLKDFAFRVENIEKEYEEVFDKKRTPDGGGILLDTLKTSDNNIWEVWRVNSFSSSRYLGGSFGMSTSEEDRKEPSYYKEELLEEKDGEEKEIKKDLYSEKWWQKEISYKGAGTKWLFSSEASGYQKGHFWREDILFEGYKVIFLIKKSEPLDKFGKIALLVRGGKVEKTIDANGEDNFSKYPYEEELMFFLKNRNLIPRDEDWLDLTKIKKLKNGKYIYDDDIRVSEETTSLSILSDYGIVEVKGNFVCLSCKKLKNLKGCPKIIRGNFNCSECDGLKNLEGSPTLVSGNVYAYRCKNLVSLVGSPKKIKGNFSCYENNKIRKLRGAPEKIGGYFSCFGCENLENFFCHETIIFGNLICHGCKKLKNFRGVPRKIGGFVDIKGCDSLVVKERDYKILKLR